MLFLIQLDLCKNGVPEKKIFSGSPILKILFKNLLSFFHPFTLLNITQKNQDHQTNSSAHHPVLQGLSLNLLRLLTHQGTLGGN